MFAAPPSSGTIVSFTTDTAPCSIAQSSRPLCVIVTDSRQAQIANVVLVVVRNTDRESDLDESTVRARSR